MPWVSDIEWPGKVHDSESCSRADSDENSYLGFRLSEILRSFYSRQAVTSRRVHSLQ